jgi:hypothetical protein
MSNLMMKKNRLMSMWLSGVNSAAGSARGLWAGELHRQQRAMMQQMIRFWTGSWTMPRTGQTTNAERGTSKRR